MISFLLPTRGRPEWLVRTIANLHAMTKREHEIIIGIDADDPTLTDYMNMLTQEPYKIFPQRTQPSAAVNALLPYALGDILCPMADDIEIHTKDWDDALLSLPADGLWVAWPHDGGNGKCTIPIMGRAWAQTVGHVFPPVLERWYGDTWVGDVAHRAGRAYPLMDIRFLHHSPCNPDTKHDAPDDDTFWYQHRDNNAHIRKDKAMYESSRGIAMRDAEAGRVRARIGARK